MGQFEPRHDALFFACVFKGCGVHGKFPVAADFDFVLPVWKHPPQNRGWENRLWK
jgi:hypothetical protein